MVSLHENEFYFFNFITNMFYNLVVSLAKKDTKNEAILFPRLACLAWLLGCWLDSQVSLIVSVILDGAYGAPGRLGCCLGSPRAPANPRGRDSSKIHSGKLSPR